jgi:hypothetical protein
VERVEFRPSSPLVPKLLFGNALPETLFREAFETGVSRRDVPKLDFSRFDIPFLRTEGDETRRLAEA